MLSWLLTSVLGICGGTFALWMLSWLRTSVLGICGALLPYGYQALFVFWAGRMPRPVCPLDTKRCSSFGRGEWPGHFALWIPGSVRLLGGESGRVILPFGYQAVFVFWAGRMAGPACPLNPRPPQTSPHGSCSQTWPKQQFFITFSTIFV